MAAIPDLEARFAEVPELVARIKEARSLLASAGCGAILPQVARCLQLADMHLHWALWNLGEVEEINPELERRESRDESRESGVWSH